MGKPAVTLSLSKRGVEMGNRFREPTALRQAQRDSRIPNFSKTLNRFEVYEDLGFFIFKNSLRKNSARSLIPGTPE